MINPRSNSVTGKYSENGAAIKHGNLLGAGALSSAVSQNNQQPSSMEGFGGIVGVSAGGKASNLNSVGSKMPSGSGAGLTSSVTN